MTNPAVITNVISSQVVSLYRRVLDKAKDIAGEQNRLAAVVHNNSSPDPDDKRAYYQHLGLVDSEGNLVFHSDSRASDLIPVIFEDPELLGWLRKFAGNNFEDQVKLAREVYDYAKLQNEKPGATKELRIDPNQDKADAMVYL